MFASFLMNLSPLLLNTETQIGDGGRFSKEYHGVLQAVRYFLSIPDFSPRSMYFKTFSSLEPRAFNKNVCLSLLINER